ncbi:MAG: hypothetical protein M0R02_04995 [Bacteroidales bacterium]|nr:hypothetical protein [Bacteroidales bacterium]
MKKILTVILTILTVTVFGQIDQTIWDSLKTVTTDNYELKIPYKWRQIPTGGQGPEQYFEAKRTCSSCYI